MILALSLGVFAGCATDDPAPLEAEVPCGIAICDIDDNDTVPDWEGNPEADIGKFDRDGVESAIALSTADGVFDADDVRDAFDAAGERVGRGEMRAIRAALGDTSYEVTAGAQDTALEMARVANLFGPERAAIESGLTAGGAPIPTAVLELLGRARLNGALAYDVQETDDDGEGVWNPYPATTPPVENMTFAHTEVTPERLAEDIAATDLEYVAIVGTEMAEYCDAAGMCQDYEQARYETRVGGTGNISAHYDHAYHPDIYARGRSGQIWANNCAILSDGSLHCLPAARRSVIQDLILTNPHLSRCNTYAGYEDACRHLLYHGHVEVRDGVVTGIEMSGRISKRAARGKASFIDPLAVLEAWGFEISPSLRVRYGNTSAGTPVRDLEAGVIREAD